MSKAIPIKITVQFPTGSVGGRSVSMSVGEILVPGYTSMTVRDLILAAIESVAPVGGDRSAMIDLFEVNNATQRCRLDLDSTVGKARIEPNDHLLASPRPDESPMVEIVSRSEWLRRKNSENALDRFKRMVRKIVRGR